MPSEIQGISPLLLLLNQATEYLYEHVAKLLIGGNGMTKDAQKTSVLYLH